jgi:hypothetical protein
MRTRTGKIARLPAAVREELNRRLDNGKLAKNLVPWLNELPDVQRVLADLFGSRPITENNLSEWRRGGFQDWLLQEERRLRIEQLTERYQSLGPEEGARRRDAHLHERLAIELMEELERLSAMKDRTERWKRLQKISRELCRLQRTRTYGSEVALFQAKRATPFQPHSSLIPTNSGLPGANRAKSHGGGVGATSNNGKSIRSYSKNQHSTCLKKSSPTDS